MQNPMTDEQRRCIRFIERILEISYTGDDSKEAASRFISQNLGNAKKCQWFKSQKDLYNGMGWETTGDNMDVDKEISVEWNVKKH